MSPEPATKRAVVFIDGQNLFHNAREAVGYTFPNYDVVALARRICAARDWTLNKVRSASDPDQNRRGYTTTPPHDGGWETGGGGVRREKTVIVYTYIKPEGFLAHVATLREFLHRVGRETNQEVVVVELSGAAGSWFFRIKEYDV